MRARWAAWMAGWALAASAPALAQPDAPVDTEPAIQQLEDYLTQLALTDVLAAHLRQRLAETTGQARTRTAERLASIYATQLGEARTAGQRLPLEQAARELLKVVPESESFDLRLNLASFEMNRVMRVLAVVSVLGLVPALAGGLLGMNLAESPWSPTLAQVSYAVASVMALLLYTFVAKGWLR